MTHAVDPSSARHPRVLIVAPTVINTVKGGGVTLGRLFRGWPLERIAQLHADVLPPDLRVCRTYYSIAGPFVRRPRRDATRRLLYLLAWLTRTGEHGLLWARISPRMRGWLAEVRPEVVLSQTGSPAFLRLTEAVVRQTGARLVLHASDDWVRQWPANVLGRRIPLIGGPLARMVEREWRELVARADVLMAVSREMADSYGERYGREWSVFGNAIDVEAWPDAPPREHRLGEPFRIMYSGSVIPTSQLEGLRDLARALAASNGAGGRFELIVSTGDVVPVVPELAAPGVRIVPPAPQAELPAHLATADLLYLPSVFTEPARWFYELSMPGKVAEYLASGRPILLYAPPTSALARSAARGGWAELVDRRDQAALGAAVRRLAADAGRRSALVDRARSVLRREFDLDVVRRAFQATIAGAAQQAKR